MTDDGLLERSLKQARDTRKLVIAVGARRQIADIFGELFGSSPCILISDDNTFAVLGKDVYDALAQPAAVAANPWYLRPRDCTRNTQLSNESSTPWMPPTLFPSRWAPVLSMT